MDTGMEVTTLGTRLLLTLAIVLAAVRSCSSTAGYGVVGVCGYTPAENSTNATAALMENLELLENGVKVANQSVSDLSSLSFHRLSYQSVDLLVFPEYGLTSLNFSLDDKTLNSILQRVGSPGWNPCNQRHQAKQTEALRRISCIAQRYQMYLVVNLGEIASCKRGEDKCSKDGTVGYNTEVVFDRKGTIVARYRKRNLYFEKKFATPKLELVTFKTDFGIEFGLTICFDIMFDKPLLALIKQKGVRYIIHSQAWVDQLPFFLAHQTLDSFAKALKVTIIASGYHYPQFGRLGSGIFLPEEESIYSYSLDAPGIVTTWIRDEDAPPNVRKNPSQLRETPSEAPPPLPPPLIPKNAGVITDPDPNWTQGLDPSHSVLTLNMKNFSKSSLLNYKKGAVTVCDGAFCCFLDYEWDKLPGDKVYYRLVATAHDNRIKDAYSWKQQVCSLVLCEDPGEDLSGCSKHGHLIANEVRLNKFRLSAVFSTDFVAPSVLLTSLELDQTWHWFRIPEGDGVHVRAVMYSREPISDPIQSLTLYGKIYSLSRAGDTRASIRVSVVCAAALLVAWRLFGFT